MATAIECNILPNMSYRRMLVRLLRFRWCSGETWKPQIELSWAKTVSCLCRYMALHSFSSRSPLLVAFRRAGRL